MADRPNNAFKLSDGANWVEIVPTPSGGTKRLVTGLNFYNADTVTVAFAYAAIYDGATYWIQGDLTSIATLRASAFLNLESVWILKNGQTLCGKLDAAVTTNECQFTAHYIDDVSEGERVLD